MKPAAQFGTALFVAVVLAAVHLPACSDDPPPSPPENAGSACASPTECYPTLDGGTLKGAVQCLTRVPGGYCTHLCTTDADCCAVPGECRGGFKQVCSPFESTGQMMCFLACESGDVAGTDANTFCQQNANTAFGCRSSGGGSKNRKVCVP